MQRRWEINMDNLNWYKLIFKQVQPIHIGAGSYGVISETRIFIPGWTIWGALTKAYNLKYNSSLSKNQSLFENISCFYPAFKNGDNFEILFPEFKNGEFCLGDYSEDEFRAKFVDTFMSTAINPLSNSALDESLHELNVILPGAKADYREKDEESLLYWVGIVEIDDKNKIPKEINIGGDVKYGLGKLILIKEPEELVGDPVDLEKFKKANYIEIKKEVQQKVPIELLVDAIGYEGKDLKIKKNGFYYMPGHGFEINEFKLEKGRLIK